MLLFLYRGYHHYHPLAFKFRHLLGFPVFLKINCKPEEKFLTLLGEQNGTTAEENVSLDLGSLLKETFGVVEPELKVVLVSLRPEAYLLYDYLGCVGLKLFCLLFLLIYVFLIVDNLTYRRISCSRYLNKIQFLLLGHLQSIRNGIYALFRHILPHHSHAWSGDCFVDPQSIILVVPVLRQTLIRLARSLRSRFRWSVISCYGLVLPVKLIMFILLSISQFLGLFRLQYLDEIVDWHSALVFPTLLAHGHCL